MDTSPPGATAEVEGLAATTPTIFDLPRGEDHTITLRKEGYAPMELHVAHKFSGAVCLNLFTCSCSPLCMTGDALAGSISSLEPDSFEVALVPLGNAATAGATPSEVAMPVMPSFRKNATSGWGMEAGLGPTYGGVGVAAARFLMKGAVGLEGTLSVGVPVEPHFGFTIATDYSPPPDSHYQQKLGPTIGARLLLGGRFRFLLGADYGHQTEERFCRSLANGWNAGTNCSPQREIYGPSAEVGYMCIDDSGFLFSLSGSYSWVDSKYFGSFARENVSSSLGYKF